MKLGWFAVAAVVALSGTALPGTAAAQEAMKPCKPARQAAGEAPAGQPPAAQQATGAPAPDRAQQEANSSACEASPPDTR